MIDDTRIPSLNALRAFAVAARCLNLAEAARELFITPSAVSHQIRNLEEHLGVSLFRRGRHGLQLTEAGHAIFPGIRDGFGLIHDALAKLRNPKNDNILHVSMLSTFAMRWFIPRLFRFQQKYPDIEVRISTSIELADLDRGDADCAIRTGKGVWPGTKTVRLFAEHFTPVCSPSLLNGKARLESPADLKDHTLLQAKLRPDDWRIWLAAAGYPGLEPRQTQVFETRNFAIAAAIRGLGVAIIDPALITEELEDGRLIQPFPQTLPTEGAYYFVWPAYGEEKTALILLRSWLLDEAGRMDA
jgi:LysR family glycine cleavage system transcriptional activator